jgi:hypothetical protein
MSWRIARMMTKNLEPKYEVAMSFSYLMNSVATLAFTGRASIPEELIPATTILEEGELVPGEIRAVYEKELKPSDKPFLLARKVRELTHQLKSSKPIQNEPLETDVDLDLIDEEDT